MAYTAKWIVKNTKHDLIFTSLSNFWSIVENDESSISQHSILNKKYCIDRGGFLAKDGKSIVYWVMFKDELDFKQWQEDYKKLPAIDKELSFTEIDTIGEEYIHYRDGKKFIV